jgi:hypothetical protein
LTNVRQMFFEASRDNQSLCAWGELLPLDANVSSMFSATSCVDMDDPMLENDRWSGPLCHSCGP